jgi:hypothetical protein
MERLEPHPLESSEKHYFRFHALIVRIVLTVDVVLFALSFWPRYAGTADMPGLADDWFGNYRLDGFRADFAWLMLSTAAVAVAFFYSLDEQKSDRRARVDVLLGGAWVIAFFVLACHALFTGTFYFG